MAKRKNGEGSWGKRTISGNLYFYYKDSSGHFTYGKTQKIVKQKLQKKQSQIVSHGNTFGEYILNWLETTKTTSLSPQSYDSYEGLINNMIIKFDGFDIANKQMGQLSSELFQKYVNALSKCYSKASITKVWMIIGQCIKYAEVKNEVSPYTIKLVNLPSEEHVKHKKKEVPFLSMEQMEIFYNSALRRKENGKLESGNNAYAIVLIMYTGMRVSECIALKWKNVDLDNKRIYIRESSAMVRNRNSEKKAYRSIDKDAKTDSSERTIPLSNRAVEAIRYFDDFTKTHKSNDYVCVNNKGKKMESHSINYTVNVIVKRAGLIFKDKFTTHSLRHSYGSVLLSKGVDIKIVSELLGHKDISTTYNIYIGILDEDKSKAVESVFD